MPGQFQPPFDVKEAIRRRRERRLDRNLTLEQTVRQWTEAHGFDLGIHNEGHHWVFKKGGLVAEWWPSSAKLALNRDYSHDIHAHDWSQVRAQLMGLAQQNPGPQQTRFPGWISQAAPMMPESLEPFSSAISVKSACVRAINEAVYG